MLCARKKAKDIKPEEKWDFISLQDFKASSFFEYLAYAYLWGSLVVSIAVYGVDTFTAYNLIALGKFTGIEPVISIDISKWIFAGCIIASWVNVFYEHVRAHLIIRRGAVAESYLDSLAVRLQAIRIFGQGRGWKRFLVFSELTKSKKGAEYVALFTYFSFQSWIRVIFCSGPRQVINVLTLRAVYIAKLDPRETDVASSILNFFKNFGILAEKDKKQAVVLSGMVFTLVIWIFAALSLLLAMCFYILYLWHYIPNRDGGLSGYCERKINDRLQKIVSVKINKAIEDEERKRVKADRKAFKNGEKPVLGRQATLPTLFDTKDNDRLPTLPMLNRNDTTATLPMYSSRPGTPSNQQPKLPGLELSNMEQKRPLGPTRLNTATSAGSYGTTSGLVANAAGMGYSRSGSPAPTLPNLDGNNNGMPFPQPQRTMTGTTNGSQGQNEWQRGPQPLRNGTPSRQMTQDSFGNGNGPLGPPSRQMTPDTFGNGNGPPGPPSRQMTQDSFGNNNGPPGPPSRQMTQDSFGGPQRNMPLDRTIAMTPIQRTASPASYAPSRPPYPVAPSSLSQGPYAPPSRGPQRQQTRESYDPYSTASLERVTEDTVRSPLDNEPTLPSFDTPTIVTPRTGTPSNHYTPSIASSRGTVETYNRAGPTVGHNGSRYGGRSTPSQGSIESNSVGRRTPFNDAASMASERTNGSGQGQYGQQPMQVPQQSRVGITSPTGSFAQPARSASAGIGQGVGPPQGYSRPLPGRNMTEPGFGGQGQGQQGGYNAYGNGGAGGQGYRM